MTPRVLLAADRITKIFPAAGSRNTAAVVDATLLLRENEVLALVGANGAGKTTLVDICATLLRPTSGALRVDDCDALANPGPARRTIGYLPSGGRSLYPRLTVLQNLAFFATLHGLCAVEARPRAEAALRLCGALDAARTRVDRLSDGLVARVALARALVHDPSALILDEPTRSIDPVHRGAVLRVLRGFADQPGKAVLIVTHNLDDVFDLADTVALMREGRIVAVSQVASARHDRGRFAAALSEAGA